MNQRYPQITSPLFGGQARSALLELVLAHLPLGIDARTIDDHLAWDILCYASVKQITIESACLALAAAPSGNTVREHLAEALDPARPGMEVLEARLNRALQAQLPAPVRRRLGRRRYEAAIDLVEIPYHGQAQVADREVRRGAPKCGTTRFHIYGTLAIVHHRQRFTLALTFAWAEEKMETVLARLLGLARALGVRPEARLPGQRLLLGRGLALAAA